MSDYLGTLRREGNTLVAEVKPHPYETPPRRRDRAGRLIVDPFCLRCGYNVKAAAGGLYVHPEQAEG